MPALPSHDGAFDVFCGKKEKVRRGEEAGGVGNVCGA